jgi:LPXTG-motif cell wall-anchored protein
MAFRRLATVAVAAAAGLVLLTPTAALANTTVNLKAAQIGLTAADKDTQENCDLRSDASQDVWVFNWDGNETDVGTVVSATIGWSSLNNGVEDFTLSYPATGTIVGGGTPKIAFVTPGGYGLTSGTSVITGTGTDSGDFVLSHTCAGTQTTPTPTVNPCDTGVVINIQPEPTCTTPDPCATTVGIPGVAAPTCTTTPPSIDPCQVVGAPAPATCTTTPGLPRTGESLTGFLIAGAALIVGGAATLVVLRRRRAMTE